MCAITPQDALYYAGAHVGICSSQLQASNVYSIPDGSDSERYELSGLALDLFEPVVVEQCYVYNDGDMVDVWNVRIRCSDHNANVNVQRESGTVVEANGSSGGSDYSGHDW
ncbi:hypothetical protein IWQ60_004427 [Tieghemiomyces parasiticus]|uniref:Uncharacterized protein n=1 Tax=Tieghemiomyces parasiticus TaxID=78921 RepID=A0A9W8AEA3_9FUNG|nr:hypothetical protein IWQ60_004427 [Tieghemiomyces parasiticus]